MGCFGGVLTCFRALPGFIWVFVLRHFLECEAPEGGPVCPQLQAEVDVAEQEGTGSDEVYFLNLHTLWFIFVFVDFLARPCLFSSFVASDTNDVD